MTTFQLSVASDIGALDRALSPAADQLRQNRRAAARTAPSVSLSEPEERLEFALAHAWEIPALVNEATREYARSLLNSLPIADRRMADIQIDPCGEVMFEWERTPRWLLTLTINEIGRIAYSGIFGSSRVRGRELFAGSVPDTIAMAIARVAVD